MTFALASQFYQEKALVWAFSVIVKISPRWSGYLHAVVGLDLLVDPGEHLLHALLVGLDVLHLALQTVLHLVLHQVDPDPRLPVLHALVVYSANRHNLQIFHANISPSLLHLSGRSVSAIACSSSDLVSLSSPFSLKTQ